MSAGNARAVLAGIRRLFPSPQWAVFAEVRSSNGANVEGLRIADAIAVDLWAGRERWNAVGFEIKVSRADLDRELRQPRKSQAIRRFCSRWYLAVPAPRKNVVSDLERIGEAWGVIEVGTGDPVVVREGVEMDALEPPVGLLLALLRAAERERECDREAAAGPGLVAGGAPSVPISRPNLSRTHVGLACGHAAMRPVLKILPARLPCLSCADGLPMDRDVVLAAIADASREDLAAFRQALAERPDVAEGWA